MKQFNPAAFVASTRSLVPLERLRDDLQEHLRDRKQVLAQSVAGVCVFFLCSDIPFAQKCSGRIVSLQRR